MVGGKPKFGQITKGKPKFAQIQGTKFVMKVQNQKK